GASELRESAPACASVQERALRLGPDRKVADALTGTGREHASVLPPQRRLPSGLCPCHGAARGGRPEDRGWRPSRSRNESPSSGCRASSVNSSISIALRRVFEGQKPRPTSMISSGAGSALMLVLLDVDGESQV